ncbi:MAG: hypothetical protein ACOX1P_20135 [Thermoguttaceae bacterium]
MGYEHTQRGPGRYLGYLAAAGMVPLIWTAGNDTLAAVAIGAAALLVVVVCEGFSRLTIRDEGDRLGVHFGPPPVWRTHILYRDMVSAEQAKTTFLDGWGVHWMPGRGMTYNVWGFDCVKIKTARRTIQLGTDDAGGLAAFLAAKIAAS